MPIESAPPPTPTTFRQVAHRIAANGTNVFATGLVLIMGVLIGRQLLDWWSAGTDEPLGSSTRNVKEIDAGLDPSDRQIEFGDNRATMRRIEIAGSAEDATTALRDACRHVADHQVAEAPPLKQAPQLDLTRLTPKEVQEGKWQLYEVMYPLPMVVVVDASRAKQNAAPTILAWGVAFREESDPAVSAWTAFVLSPPSATSQSTADLAVPLPPGCQRLIALTDNRTTVVSFSSKLPAEDLAKRFDSEQASTWQPLDDWQTTGQAWHRRYQLTSGGNLDLQFARSPNGELLGFCILVRDR